VRGTTSRKIVTMIRNAGAREVHLRISSPPTVGPCRYGIDTPTREELIAANHTISEIRDFVGADSVGYLSLEGLYTAVQELKAVGEPGGLGAGPKGFCDACFSNQYPVPVEGPPRPRQLRLLPA
jgi:amidophosphoribosyltransferase